MKKKNLVPLIVFLLGMCLVGCIVYKTDTHEKWQRRTTAQLNVSTYGERIKNEITNGIAITDALKQVLISENGEFSQFDTIAENLISDSIESVQLAPDGVVTDIYPADKNFLLLSAGFYYCSYGKTPRRNTIAIPYEFSNLFSTSDSSFYIFCDDGY